MKLSTSLGCLILISLQAAGRVTEIRRFDDGLEDRQPEDLRIGADLDQDALPATVFTSSNLNCTPITTSLTPTRVEHSPKYTPPSTSALLNTFIHSGYLTTFRFELPSSSPPFAASNICALRFRLPFASTLDPEYPPFIWSGMEQQEVGKSGMKFSPSYVSTSEGGVTEERPWEGVAPAQVGGGEDEVIVARFGCGAFVENKTEGTLVLETTVESVNDWSLEYMQAGVGNRFGSAEGVGVSLVVCGDEQ